MLHRHSTVTNQQRAFGRGSKPSGEYQNPLCKNHCTEEMQHPLGEQSERSMFPKAAKCGSDRSQLLMGVKLN